VRIEPLEDRVLIKPLEAEEKTPGGIVLPDTAKEKPQRGEVIAVGPGRMLDSGKRAPVSVKKGDTVVFPKYGGDMVKIGTVEHRIVREADILAILE
jgi:chaperonin GroES